MKEARGTCWVGYQQIGMKKKNGKMVPNCVKEDVEIYYEEMVKDTDTHLNFLQTGLYKKLSIKVAK